MGYPADWIEHQLAHAEPNAVRRTYNHADYLSERLQMMMQWVDALDAWKRSELSKVMPLRRQVAA
jgi:integrase